jgi:chromosomal replication initiation ATPase DnaA
MCVAEKLRSLLPDDMSPETIFAITPPTFSDILLETACFYRLDPENVLFESQHGKRRLAMPRMMVCKLTRQLTKLSLSQIANRLGYTDHTTVHCNARKITARIDAGDEIVADDLDILKRRILDRVMDRCGGTSCR